MDALRRDGYELRLKFHADSSYLPLVRKVNKNIIENLHCSEQEAFLMVTAMEEAITNIIKHAYSIQHGDIEIVFKDLPKELQIVLLDYGKQFYPEEFEQLKHGKVVQGRKGKLGIFMMNKIMDVVQHRRVDGANELTMIKYRRQESEHGSNP